MGTDEEGSSARPSETSDDASTSYAERLGWRPKADRDADVAREKDEAQARSDRIAKRVADVAPFVGDTSFAARAKTVGFALPRVQEAPSFSVMPPFDVPTDFDEGMYG